MVDTLFPLLVVFIFGTIIGSFLNVVILRLHTGRSLNGRSHCMTCGEQLGARELIPVMSYLMLMGKCKKCGARFSVRYALVEVLTGSAFILAYSASGDPVSFLAQLSTLCLLVVVLVYDLDHLIIPDEVVVLLCIPAFVLMVWTGSGFIFSPFNLLAPVAASGFFYILWKVSGGRWIGLGDAKLAAPLALMVGLSNTFSFVVCAFWVGALISISVLAFQKMRQMRGQHSLHILRMPLTMKSEIPFAPFLIASFVLVYFFHFSAFHLTDTLISYVI